MYLWAERQQRYSCRFWSADLIACQRKSNSHWVGRYRIQVPDMLEIVVLLPTLSGFSGSMMNRPLSPLQLVMLCPGARRSNALQTVSLIHSQGLRSAVWKTSTMLWSLHSHRTSTLCFWTGWAACMIWVKNSVNNRGSISCRRRFSTCDDGARKSRSH